MSRRITEHDLAFMSTWITSVAREKNVIRETETIECFSPFGIRVWCVFNTENSDVRVFDGGGSTRRELWNTGRAILWAMDIIPVPEFSGNDGE